MNYITKTMIGGIRPINIAAFSLPKSIKQPSLHLSYENYLGAYSLIKNNQRGVGDSAFVCRISGGNRRDTEPERLLRRFLCTIIIENSRRDNMESRTFDNKPKCMFVESVTCLSVILSYPPV